MQIQKWESSWYDITYAGDVAVRKIDEIFSYMVQEIV